MTGIRGARNNARAKFILSLPDRKHHAIVIGGKNPGTRACVTPAGFRVLYVEFG
jgi:hypothetical protein